MDPCWFCKEGFKKIIDLQSLIFDDSGEKKNDLTAQKDVEIS